MHSGHEFGWRTEWGIYSPHKIVSVGLDTIISALNEDITIAQTALDSKQADVVGEAFSNWNYVGLQVWRRAGELITFTEATQEQRNLIAVGMLGLTRQMHTSANNHIQRGEDSTTIRQRIHRITRVYEHIDPNTVPQQSIHGSQVYWPGEIESDRGVTEMKLGNSAEARQHFGESWQQSLVYVGEHTHTDKATGIVIHDKSTAGAYSAAAVALGREALLDTNMVRIKQSLEYMENAMCIEPNNGRMKTLLKWAGFLLKEDFVPRSKEWRQVAGIVAQWSPWLLGQTLRFKL